MTHMRSERDPMVNLVDQIVIVIGKLNPSSVPADNICPKYTNNNLQRFYYLPQHEASLKKAESLTSAKF